MNNMERAMEKAVAEAGRPPVIPVSGTPGGAADPPEAIDWESRRLVAANDYNLPITEEYRKLKSIVIQMTAKNPGQNLLLVSSSIGGEGKSVTALNLAISLAQEHDREVLIIDADLRKPSIARYLGLTQKKGLAECLKEGLDVNEALIRTGLGNLSFLPAGASDNNPVELYSSQKMSALLAAMKERFSNGFVIVDCSPVLPFTEARILANLVDGVIYVVKEGGTSLANIEEGLNALFEATVIGLVYNKATAASLSGGYHYYYYDYDYQRRGRDQAPKPPGRLGGFLSRLRKPNPAP